jgi:phosphoserine phosphatase
MKSSQSFLLTIQGAVSWKDVLENIMEQLGSKSIVIQDIHYLNYQEVHTLLVRFELSDTAYKDHLLCELEAYAKKNNLELIINSIPEAAVETLENRYILTLLSQQIHPRLLTNLFLRLRENQLQITEISPLDAEELNVLELTLQAKKSVQRQSLMKELLGLKSVYNFDLALQADDIFRRNKRLIFLDADMTFIQCEMINEMSRLCGKEAEVEAITDCAMQGKIEFKQALRQRVALLKGLPLIDLDHLISNIPYTPGVERLVYILKTLGYKIGLVSGGFTRVIEHIKKRFDLNYGYANALEVKNGKLTGRLSGDILDGHQKGVILQEVANRENIIPDQVIAVGDGANDLEMLSSAGLGIAFNAKRFLRERASGSLSLPNLDALLYFLGISRYEVDSLFQRKPVS